MAKLFLSYDRDDADKAQAIAGALEKAGHQVWWDRHIRGGAEFSEEIEQALDNADTVIVLWSTASVKSAWVRDEAAAGRDSGRLVPVLIEPIKPPMGFRQYQAVDLAEWNPRRKSNQFDELLEAARERSSAPRHDPVEPTPKPIAARTPKTWPRWATAAAFALALLLIGVAGWKWLGSAAMPVVEVAAADGSPRSQAAANDLFVKLGSLAQIADGKWQLVDQSSAPSKPSFVFRTADTGSASKPQSSLVLLDGASGTLLWSREFAAPDNSAADLRQQMALTAGRVLQCALESSEDGGLKRDTLKLFLNGCASLAESGFDTVADGAALMRQVVAANPKFTPAWGPLIIASQAAVQVSDFSGGQTAELERMLAADVAKAKQVAPDLPELALIQVEGLPPTNFAAAIKLLEQAKAKAPENSTVLGELASQYMRVGRVSESVDLSQRVAELNPLNPNLQQQYILSLAYAGRIQESRVELAKAEKLWAGTGALRDLLWGFHMRFGDPDIAMKVSAFPDSEDQRTFFAARRDPSPANLKALDDLIQRRGSEPNTWGQAIQAYGEFGQLDKIVAWIARTPVEAIARDSYILFRPQLKIYRDDPRFMRLADRIRLIDYWRASGKWPDFCTSGRLSYDCKAEAAKYAH